MNGDWKIPSVSSYAPGYAQGALYSDAGMGWQKIRKNYASQPVNVTASYSMMTEHDLLVFFQFYYGALRGGQRKFYAKLDISGELAVYVCQLMTAPKASGWTGYSATISMTMQVVRVNNTNILNRVRYVEDPYCWDMYTLTHYEDFSKYSYVEPMYVDEQYIKTE